MPNADDPTAVGQPSQGDPDASPRPRIDGYVLHEALAAGGFGVVYRAAHVERGTPVALKILHAELATRPEIVLRFEREVEAIRRTRHPNVVEVLDQGRAPDGRPYFTMELLSGTSLRDHLETRGRLPIDEAITILEPLCAAIDAAHAQGIIHRDIKASNVFLADHGSARRVVLLDFGLAKLLDALGPALTASRHLLGTIACMAPEQILTREVDARTDVYALGALAYQMLTGEPPFAARSPQAVLQMHLYTLPQPPSARAPVSPVLDEAVLRALRKSPEERPGSAGAFLAEIRVAVADPEGDATASLRALAVYIEVRADPEAMDAPDEQLLADLESILPRAAEDLARAGFRVVTETGTSLLLALDLPDDPAEEEARRRRALEDAADLHERLERREGRHDRIHVQIWAHTGALRSLLEVAAWLPEGATSGFFASPEALDGIDPEASGTRRLIVHEILTG